VNSLEQAAQCAEELNQQSETWFIKVSTAEAIIAKHLEAFARGQQKHDRLTKENNILRGLVAKTVQPCHYCGVENISKCPSGFPGCDLADDIAVAEDDTFKRLLEQKRELMSLIRDMLEEPLLLPETMARAREALDKAIAKGDV